MTAYEITCTVLYVLTGNMLVRWYRHPNMQHRPAHLLGVLTWPVLLILWIWHERDTVFGDMQRRGH